MDSIFALQTSGYSQAGKQVSEKVAEGADFASLLAGIVSKGSATPESRANTTINAKADITNGTVGISLKVASGTDETVKTISEDGNVVPGILTIKSGDGSEINIPVLLVKKSVDEETEDAVVAVLIPTGFIEALDSIKQTDTIQLNPNNINSENYTSDNSGKIDSEISDSIVSDNKALINSMFSENNFAVTGEVLSTDKPQMQIVSDCPALDEEIKVSEKLAAEVKTNSQEASQKVVSEETSAVQDSFDTNYTLNKVISNNDENYKGAVNKTQVNETIALKDSSVELSGADIDQDNTISSVKLQDFRIQTDDNEALTENVLKGAGKGVVTSEDTSVRSKNETIVIKAESSLQNNNLSGNSNTITDILSSSGKYFIVDADALEGSAVDGQTKPVSFIMQETETINKINTAQVIESGTKNISELIDFIKSKISGGTQVQIEQFTQPSDAVSQVNTPVELTGSDNEAVSTLSSNSQLTDFTGNSSSGFLYGLEMSNTGLLNRMNIKNAVFISETKPAEDTTVTADNLGTEPAIELTSDNKIVTDINVPDKTLSLDISAEKASQSESISEKTDLKIEKSIVLEKDSGKIVLTDKENVSENVNRPVADYELKTSAEWSESPSENAHRIPYGQTENIDGNNSVKDVDRNISVNEENNLTKIKDGDNVEKPALTVNASAEIITDDNSKNDSISSVNDNEQEQLKIKPQPFDNKSGDYLKAEKTQSNAVSETTASVNQYDKTDEDEKGLKVKQSVNIEVEDKTVQKENIAGAQEKFSNAADTQENSTNTSDVQKNANKVVMESGESQIKAVSPENDNKQTVKMTTDSSTTVNPDSSNNANANDANSGQINSDINTAVYLEGEESENIKSTSDKTNVDVADKTVDKKYRVEVDMPKEQPKIPLKDVDTAIAEKSDSNVINEKANDDNSVSLTQEKNVQTKPLEINPPDVSQDIVKENETLKQKVSKITSSELTGSTETQAEVINDEVKKSSLEIEKKAATPIKTSTSDSPDETSDTDVNIASMVNTQSKTEKTFSGNNVNNENIVDSQVQESSEDIVRRIARNDNMKKRSGNENGHEPVALPRKATQTTAETQNIQVPFPGKGIELSNTGDVNNSSGISLADSDNQNTINLQGTASTSGTDWKTQTVLSQRESANGRMVYNYDDKQFVDNIVRQAKMLSAGGLNGMVISLDPPSLGHMKLDIVTDNSKITGKIMVESNEVKNLLQNNMSQLRDALSQSGLMVESFDVQVGNNNNSGTWENAENYKSAMKTLRDSRNNLIENISPQIINDTSSVRNRISGNNLIDFWV